MKQQRFEKVVEDDKSILFMGILSLFIMPTFIIFTANWESTRDIIIDTVFCTVFIIMGFVGIIIYFIIREVYWKKVL